MPSDAAMMFLSSLWLGLPYRTDGGELGVEVRPRHIEPVPAEALDELEGRGWLDLGGAEPRVTEKGEYAVRKWCRRHLVRR